MGGKQYKCSNFHTKVLISSANNYCPFGEQLLAFFEANLANNVFSTWLAHHMQNLSTQ